MPLAPGSSLGDDVAQSSSWLQEVLEALTHRRQTQTQETLELNELVRSESFTLCEPMIQLFN